MNHDSQLAFSPQLIFQPSGQELLQDLRHYGLLFPDEWATLPASLQEELEHRADQTRTLEKLVEFHLLTEYQAGRISLGCMGDLALGNYRILDLLGAGAMGKVLKAEHRLLRRTVAIKILTEGPGNDPLDLERFFNEMRTVAQLNHPNIAAALDAGEQASSDIHHPSLHYFVMEFVPGMDLDAYVKKNGPLNPAFACDLAFQIAGALEEANKHRLVHRDVKPSNIRVTPDGDAKLLDFGIAKIFWKHLTAPGMVLGSVAFLAPEQAEDSSTVDIRADIYALGGTLFWCLTGQLPFPSKGGNIFTEVVRRIQQTPPSVRALRPDLPAELDAVLQKMMAHRPGQRYANPREVMEAFFPFLKPGTHVLDGQVLPLETASPVVDEPNIPNTAKVHRILIVDDEVSYRSFLTLVLASSGLHCQEASNGTLGLEMLYANPFDLVLLDIDMPEMKGTEVLRKLRETPPTPHLKIIMVSGRASPDDMAQMMLAGADDYLAKPFSNSQLHARVQTALRLKDAQDRSNHLHRHMLAVNQELETHLHSRDVDLIQARNALVLALAELVSYRDNETGNHLLRLQKFSGLLARTAAHFPSFAEQIDDNFIQMLECCAPLHDIGKAALPDHILLKPGKLTADEFAIMKTHTTLGADLLQKVARQHGFAQTFLQMATDITRYHHERWDGAGYPDRLARDQIPLSARIVAIADVYDALRCRRVYKPALPHGNVVEIMVKQSEGHFDPALLAVFQQCHGQFEALFTSLGNNHR